MEHSRPGYFDLVLGTLKGKTGYSVIECGQGEDNYQVFHFDTLEEFEENFTSTYNELYQSYGVEPKQIVERYGQSVDCIIDGSEFYLNRGELYLVIDGVLSDGLSDHKKLI